MQKGIALATCMAIVMGLFTGCGNKNDQQIAASPDEVQKGRYVETELSLPEEWKDRELDFCRKYYDRIVADTPFKPDAASGIRRLRELGHRIVIITGRTADFYTDPYKTTGEELSRGGIVYDKLICTLDKAAACVRENISVLVDDIPGNCSAAAEKGIKAILFDSRANRDAITEFPRVENWTDAVETILKSV